MGQKFHSVIVHYFFVSALWFSVLAAFGSVEADASIYDDVLRVAEFGGDGDLLLMVSRLCHKHPGLTPDIAALSASVAMAC